MLKLVIFDYDGLLVDSERLAFLAEKKILKELGKNLARKYFNNYLGYSVEDTLKSYINHFRLSISLKELVLQRNELINQLVESSLKLRPGAKKLLNFLKQSGVAMVIASSGEESYINKGLVKFMISSYFKDVIPVSDVKRGKPYPDLYLEAVKRMGVRHDQAIVLEDSVSGIEAAKKAKIFSIAIPPAGVDHQKYHQADLILVSLKGVINLFKKSDFFKKSF